MNIVIREDVDKDKIKKEIERRWLNKYCENLTLHFE
jgi:hypothetical protein